MIYKNDYIESLIETRQDEIFDKYTSNIPYTMVSESILSSVKKLAINSLKWLGKTILFTLITITALLGYIYIVAKQSEKYHKKEEKIRKERWEELIQKNPQLIQNIGKLSNPIYKALCQSNKNCAKYLVKRNITTSDVVLGREKSLDEYVGDNVAIVVHGIVAYDCKKMIKDFTGFNSFEELCKSQEIDPDSEDVDDVELTPEFEAFLKEFDQTIKSVDEYLKSEFKGIISIWYGYGDPKYPVSNLLLHNDITNGIGLTIRGDINNFNVPEPFKAKVKELIHKML